MPRVIFKLNNGDYINVVANQIDVRDNFVCAWEEEYLVAMVKEEMVVSCHLSEKEGVKNG
jgi:hypothetical protein